MTSVGLLSGDQTPSMPSSSSSHSASVRVAKMASSSAMRATLLAARAGGST